MSESTSLRDEGNDALSGLTAQESVTGPPHDAEPPITMSTLTTGTLQVPGATLHYEACGTGPLLLLISGGVADAAIFRGLATCLSERYTVVTYDPRGYSRSPFHGPAVEQRVERHSDDARRLLQALCPAGERAFAFGSSTGAIVALDLMARHPGQLRRVVAHEPPSVELLPDAAEHRSFFARVHRTYRREGPGPAMTVFNAGIGMADTKLPAAGEELPPQLAEVVDRMNANLPCFLEHILRQFTAYLPDVQLLVARSERLVLAGGRTSRGHLPHRSGVLLADHLGTDLIEFPGGHAGYAEYPPEFADLLDATLLGQRAGAVQL